MNYTVDDFQRDRIRYVPNDSWRSLRDGLTRDRYMESTTFTTTQDAYAVFQFKGSAIYYGGYGEDPTDTGVPGTIRVKLDDATVDVSANINPQHQAQQILYSGRGLDPNIEHTIIIQKTSESGTRGLNIDFFTYTVPEGMNDTQIMIPFVPAATDSAGAPLGLILGGVFAGVIAIMLLVILILWYLSRRRRWRRQKRSLPLEQGQSYPLMATQHWEYPSTLSRLPPGYTAHGRGPSNYSASIATGGNWLSPNTTPEAGVFAPGITSACSSPPLPQGEPPPPC